MTIKTLMMTGAALLISAAPAAAGSRTFTHVSSNGSTTHYYAAKTAADPVQDDGYYGQDINDRDDADVEDRSATQWYPVPSTAPQARIVYGAPVYLEPMSERARVINDSADDQDIAVTTTTESYVVMDKNRETMLQQPDWNNRGREDRQ